MKIEKLRNNHKKEIIIGTILIAVIGGALTFRLTHSKYRVTQSIDLGSGVINYKPYDFKIMAMYQQKDGSTCTENSCYDEITDRMPSSGYVINTSKSYCTLDNVNHDNDAKVYTYEGKHVFENLKKSDKCYLYFDKYTAGNYILANVTVKEDTPDFSQITDTDEGVYSTTDGMYNGTTYYWRGAATTNHVIFANKCWRIIRINGDKTIRLIYNGTIHENNTCTGNGVNNAAVIIGTTVAERYYATSDGKYDNPSYVGWTYTLSSQRPLSTTSGTSSNAKTQTDNWYNDNIGNNATYNSKVAEGSFCNDRNIGSGSWTTSTSSSFYYAGYTRLKTNKNPTFDCPSSDVYALKAGTITADEVAFAGGKYYASDGSSNNTTYYLYIDQIYWTMSPAFWYNYGNGTARVFVIRTNGSLDCDSYAVHSTDVGLRPVINLKSNVTFSSGNGTQNTPYVVS